MDFASNCPEELNDYNYMQLTSSSADCFTESQQAAVQPEHANRYPNDCLGGLTDGTSTFFHSDVQNVIVSRNTLYQAQTVPVYNVATVHHDRGHSSASQLVSGHFQPTQPLTERGQAFRSPPYNGELSQQVPGYLHFISPPATYEDYKNTPTQFTHDNFQRDIQPSSLTAGLPVQASLNQQGNSDELPFDVTLDQVDEFLRQQKDEFLRQQQQFLNSGTQHPSLSGDNGPDYNQTALSWKNVSEPMEEAVRQIEHVPKIQDQPSKQAPCKHQYSAQTSRAQSKNVAIQSSYSRQVEKPAVKKTSCEQFRTMLEDRYSEGTVARLDEIKHISCHRQNFATKLNERVFCENDRMTLNMSGTKNKGQLDCKWIDVIKEIAFAYYPLKPFEDQQVAWSACVRDIHSKNRQLKHKARRKLDKS